MAGFEGDGHVHVYPEFDRARIIRAGLARARQTANAYLLLVVDREGESGFDSLRELGGATDEASSLRFEDAEGHCYAVAGRQLVSDGGLEVLGLGLAPSEPAAQLSDREHSALELVERLLSAGAAVVLPWGLGKWLGDRGRTVAELCARAELIANPRFLLGDVGQRSRPWPRPAVFAAGPRVLSGSDALPVAGAEQRIGRYGFRMEDALKTIDRETPTRSWLEALDLGAAIQTSGRRESLVSTLREQLAYRRASRGR